MRDFNMTILRRGMVFRLGSISDGEFLEVSLLSSILTQVLLCILLFLLRSRAQYLLG